MANLGRALAGLVGASVLLTAALAMAQAGELKGRRGFEVMIRPGYGSAGSKSPVVYRKAPGVIVLYDLGQIFRGDAEPYGGGFVGELSAGYRFLPFASAGLYGQLRSSSADAPDDGTKDLSRSAWGAGFYGRFYLAMLHESLDPYLQIGIGYAQDTQKFTRALTDPTLGTQDVDWELKHHGVVLPLGIGVGYRVLPMLSIGPSFRYDVVFPAGGCFQSKVTYAGLTDTEKYCTDDDDYKRITEANGYGVWSVGLDIKGTF